MPVTDSQVAALRAFLVHDAVGMTQLAAQLGNAGMPGYQYLAEAALLVAARQRFAPQYTGADLVRFVAATRASRLADGDEYDFDPLAGEDVLHWAVGQDTVRTLDPGERFRAVIALLDAFVESESPSAEDVDGLLAQARAVASRWMTNGQLAPWTERTL